MAHGQEHFDVLIVGAGLSGIGAAHHLSKRRPGKRYAILEGRAEMGGTWDLFRYPGIRSDSDMYTLGYRFRPWRAAKAIADGPSIRAYVRETAEEDGSYQKIRFNHWVTDAAWSSEEARWTVTAMHDGAPVTLTCDFLWMCAGYYRYDKGYTPDLPGIDSFGGVLVHPQIWPENLDYKGKQVVVIGSGATAVTLIPSMADDAAHITMLQRSPTYMFSMPAASAFARWLKGWLPDSVVYRIMRWQRIVLQQFTYKMARKFPKNTRQSLIRKTRERLKPDFDVNTHFSPSYNPWDQRICLVPDDDLFDAINEGKASVVTDEIEQVTPTGIKLKSGKELAADVLITATGLIVQILGGVKLTIDGRAFNPGDAYTYKGLMFSGVPNLVSVFGYTNASWTLRADLVSDYVCRLINYMDKHGIAQATPVPADPNMPREPFLDFTSGYVTRAIDSLPKQGDCAPWRQPQDYATDMVQLRFGAIDDGVMQFKKKTPAMNAASKDAAPHPVAAE